MERVTSPNDQMELTDRLRASFETEPFTSARAQSGAASTGTYINKNVNNTKSDINQGETVSKKLSIPGITMWFHIFGINSILTVSSVFIQIFPTATQR